MQRRNILPLCVLFVSACAQVPSSQEDSALHEGHAVPRNSSAQALPAAVKPVPPPLRSPASVASPTLQSADALAKSTAVAPELEVPTKSLWPRITRGFALAPMDNDLVREWENWYANRPDYVARMIHRSSRFLFHVVEQVEKHNMPMEIALLPMIESAYNPVAYSKAHASGMWQFVPGTGRDFGLRQNWWYDGRRDVLRATDAALEYLGKLYGMFGDWQLALASYNWGEGAVGRAMERNRQKGLPTDYESLTVPAETRAYLPKLIAVKNIISDPAKYGLVIADIPNEPYFDTVTLRRHIDMKLAAKLAEMSIEDFKFLNPGHSKPVIKAGEAERIVLPREKIATFLANYEKHDKPLVSWQAVRLRAGEKAERVAADHGMTLAELKELNGLQNQKKLVVGQPLLVPLKEGSGDPQLLDLPATPVSLPKAIMAAKAAAHSSRIVVARGGKAGVQRSASRTVAPVQKGRALAARPLRPEAGRQVKVVATPKAAAGKKAPAQRVKVAAR